MESSRKLSLKKNSLSIRSQSLEVKLPSINKVVTSDYRRPSVQVVESKYLNVHISRNSINDSKRNSIFRRGSTNQNQNAYHSVTFEVKSEGDILRECVPLSNVPRFSSELFDEGKFTTFKGYEHLLRKEIEKNNPEYSTILSDTFPATKTVKLNNNVLHQKITLEKEFNDICYSKEDEKRVKDIEKVNDNKHVDFSNNDDEENEKVKLLMSRHIQFAQVLLDRLKIGSSVRSNKYAEKLYAQNFNIIQAFNWWNKTWQNFFIP